MTRHASRPSRWFPLLLLLLPGAFLYGGRVEPRRDDGLEDPVERAMQSRAGRLAERVALPEPFSPPPEFAPFGRAIAPRILQGHEARGLLLTNLGHVDWDAGRDEIAAGMPAVLRLAPGEARRAARGTLRPGLNYVRLSEAAIAARGLDAVQADVEDLARIVGWLPERTLLLQVGPRDTEALLRLAAIDRARALEPYQKISPLLGTLPRLSRREAENPDLRARVTLVPGLGGTVAAEALGRVPGVRELVADDSGEGATLRIRFDRIAELARRDEVLAIEPALDFVLANAEGVPTIQAGSAEDAEFARPFDAVGVDGGGIDTNGDGQRINDGTDNVPPQIVTVTDNGISVDTPSFSQTATQTIVSGFLIGPTHRKIHAIQNVTDSGTTCDAPLSGGGTHGNTVASIIAAAPSVLGVYATKSGLGGSSEPRNMNLDGVARGARIIVQDAGTTAQCTIHSMVERGGNLFPGPLSSRLAAALSGAGNDGHLVIFPFGSPNNFGPITQGGTYPSESNQVDTFLYNNRDYMVFAPAGNFGAQVGQFRLSIGVPVIPGPFDGSVVCLGSDPDSNDCLNPVQVSAPATAKNIVAVGASQTDCFTLFGVTDCEGTLVNFSSRGPATPSSLRMAPMLTAPGVDADAGPFTSAVAVFRSNDNDNLPPVDAVLDEGNTGTSFSSAYVTGAAAVLRDYFAQGFYPTGGRGPAGDRMPSISGALVKAALAASADFNEGVSCLNCLEPPGEDTGAERTLRRTRCVDLGSSPGPGIMCNSEQGYGRPVLTNVLPLAGWSDTFVLHPASGMPREYPAAGLLVFDRQSTGEALIDNGASTSVSHLFRVAGPSTIPTGSGGLAIAAAQLRIALAWTDRPSPAGSGGSLINDLDLRLESPGPDSCLDAAALRPDGSACPANAAADNVFYNGNDYGAGRIHPVFDQWSKGRGVSPELHDPRNPVEAIHLSADPDNDRSFADSVLSAGLWRVTVKRGLGGATPGSITITVPTVAQDADQIEDDNNNGRLDAGEDNNSNGLLDQPGQPYALVVSGPVFAGEPAPPLGPPVFPVSRMTLDRVAYDCGSGAIASIYDTTPGASAALASSVTTFTVLGSDGAVLDTETGIAFTAPVPGAAASAPVPIRLAGPAVSGNGILEADTGQAVRARYAPAGQAAVEATAAVRCSPDLIPESFAAMQGSGSQVSIQGGCDNDPFPDAGEVVSYGVAIRNRSRQDSYADVVATLTASGPAAGAVRVLDSPRPVGLLPDGGANGVFFQVYVDPAAVAAIPAAQRIVTMRLDLDSSERGVRLGRQSYTFTHALDSDRDIRRYSTDAIAGGREVRDLNRNGLIDPPGQVDFTLGYVLPPEDVTFASLFSGTGAPAGHFTNELGEDLDLSGTFNGAERNIVPNVDGTLSPMLDKGILNSSVIADPNHRVPWNFDNNSGGWIPFRHPESTPSGLSVNPLWEYKTGGHCGFQTAAGLNKFGVWHSGDGDPATPVALPAPCDNHARPSDGGTPARFDLVFDVVESPIVARVNQALDARGFPYAVEFQRLGLNLNIQLIDGYAGGGVNLDNDADSDSIQSLLGQRMDAYYTRTLGGWPQAMVRFNNDWPGQGIDPTNVSFNVQPPQRTFGPFQNPNGSPGFDGDESGFPGFTQNSNPNSTTPIPNAPPDFLPYPQPAAILAGVCTGGGAAGEPCDTADAGDPCVLQGGVCTPQDNSIAGPVRNFDITLLGYEGGFASLNNAGAVENVMNYLPGPAGNRWQIGIGFWAIESSIGQTDYGVGFDDVVFEWNEWHPEDEATLGVPPACSRFAGAGQPAGGPCATVTVDRTTLYECDETIEITVRDAKCTTIGAGATATLGGACLAHAECGAGGVCTAALAAVEVAVVTESDATLVVADDQTLLYPTAKRFTLPAAAGTPGLFRGPVSLTTVKQGPGRVFANPATDHRFVVYYFDPLCDGDRDGQAGEDDFDNTDGDGVAEAADNCPLLYNPLQEDGDADGTGDLCDNCPIVSNPDQADDNADGIGDVCEFDDADLDGFPPASDNCPDVRNPNQADIDIDARGDLCDTLKTSGITFGHDGSGGDTGAVSCNFTTGLCTRPTPAVGAACATDEDCIRSCDAGTCSNTGGFVSPQPTVGQACVTHADCYIDIDRDADGVVDALDNCVIADNGPLQGPNDQADSDGDGLGDVCDGDCAGAVQAFRCRSNSNPCVPPVPSNQAVCNTDSFGLGAQCTAYVQNAGSCSDVDDDADADGVADLADGCAAIADPAIVPGGPQRDRDRDGLGDACDPAGAPDDAGDGLPDDVVAFQGTLACSTRPLVRLTPVDVPAYVDLDGDHDPFPDTGERGRVTFTVRNDGPALEDAVVTMVSSDPDVACITEAQIVIPTLAAGATLALGSLEPGQPGFTFVASDALQSQPPPAPVARIDLSFQVTAPGLLGNATTLAVSLLADYNAPPGGQQFTLGPDGLSGTADDGKVIEKFDVDRNGDGNFTVRDTFLTAIAPGQFRGTCSNAPLTLCASAADCPAGGLCQSGAYLRGSDTGVAGTVAATTCGGAYFSYGPFCRLDPDFPMDWHVHCPHGATNCPNLESGTCVGGCSFDTPNGGNHALSGSNSLHMGAHFRPDDALAGDTTHLRTLQGFMTPPINLAIMPRPGDLDFSFFHIARLMDNNGVGPGNRNQCADCGDVQIQIDLDPNPSVDAWGFWDKLVPYQNVYDHKPNAWSVFGGYYCIFTPIDTGTAPPNPRGVHETICYPQGAWSHCGSTIGTVPTATVNCTGPGEVDPTGVGVWVQTRFHLDSYLGQRIRIRWIAETWNFDESASSYYEVSGSWASTQQDDGWWLDDIVLTGVVTQQVSPILDTTPRAGTCPSDACNAAIGDMGTNAVLEVTDPAGAPIDGVSRIPTSGERIRLGASGSTFPGGCSNGHAEYQFLRDGAVAQAWSANPFFTDSPERTTRYTLLVRCTSDPGCTSAAGASIDLPVRTGEGGDVVFGARSSSLDPGAGVRYFRGACSAGSAGAPCNEADDCGAGGACTVTPSTGDDVTVLRLWSASDDGLDVVRGTVPPGPFPKGTLDGSFWTLPGLSGPCFLSDLPGAAAATGFNHTSGPLAQGQDSNPPPGGIIYYQAAANSPGGANLDAWGCPSPSICSNPGWCDLGANPGAPCTTNAGCPGGGTCVVAATACASDTGMAGLGGCGHHTTCAGGTSAGKLCLVAADCPGGGTCPAATAAQQGTEGQVCLTLRGAPLAPAPYGQCPPAGHPKRVVSRTGGLACP